MGENVFKGAEIVGTSDQSFSHAIEVAVARALPTRNLAAHLPEPPARGRTLVLGAGKAAGAMAAGAPGAEGGSAAV